MSSYHLKSTENVVVIPHPAAKDKSNSKYCSVLKHVFIEPATIQDYHRLAQYHYRYAKMGPIAGVWAIRDRHPLRHSYDEPVGVIVYTYPALNLAARNIATKKFFIRPDKAEGASLLNRHVRCISRVIVDPRWRALGLASWLVGETMPMLNAAMIESMALMGRFHPFLEKAGLHSFTPPSNPATEKLIATLESLNIPRSIWYDPHKVQVRMDVLGDEAARLLQQRIKTFLGRFGCRRYQESGIERTAFILERLAQPWAYFAWLNPKIPIAGLTLSRQTRRGEPVCSPFVLLESPSGQTHRSAPAHVSICEQSPQLKEAAHVA